MPNQDEIVDRAGVGDDQLHPSESQTLEILQIAAHILNGDVGPYPMGLQEAVEFVTRLEAQQTSQLCFRYALRLVFLKGEALQNPARQSLTAAAAPQTSSVSSQLSSEKAAAAYQSAMNAKGLYGYQSTLGATSLMA